MKASACFTLTWPEGIGRVAVRATLPSISRSVMSFQVQPAPRIAVAPMPNSTPYQISIQTGSPDPCPAMATPHQQGSSNSQVPIGRSQRARRA